MATSRDQCAVDQWILAVLLARTNASRLAIKTDLGYARMTMEVFGVEAVQIKVGTATAV